MHFSDEKIKELEDICAIGWNAALGLVRESLERRSHGAEAGGDAEVMRLVDLIVNLEVEKALAEERSSLEKNNKAYVAIISRQQQK